VISPERVTLRLDELVEVEPVLWLALSTTVLMLNRTLAPMLREVCVSEEGSLGTLAAGIFIEGTFTKLGSRDWVVAMALTTPVGSLLDASEVDTTGEGGDAESSESSATTVWVDADRTKPDPWIWWIPWLDGADVLRGAMPMARHGPEFFQTWAEPGFSGSWDSKSVDTRTQALAVPARMVPWHRS